MWFNMNTKLKDYLRQRMNEFEKTDLKFRVGFSCGFQEAHLFILEILDNVAREYPGYIEEDTFPAGARWCHDRLIKKLVED